MKRLHQHQWSIAGIAFFGLWAWVIVSQVSHAQQPPQAMTPETKSVVNTMSQILGRPTDRSITLSVLAPNDIEAYVQYGTKQGAYPAKTAVKSSKAAVPVELFIDKLKPNTHYYYRLQYRQPGGKYTAGEEYGFQTQRPAGSAFVFGVEGDSHPERIHRMDEPELFHRTLAQARGEHPDFYIALGDDFSVDTVTTLNPEGGQADLHQSTSVFRRCGFFRAAVSSERQS